MSPQITWRNGGPLMLPGNVVGGSEKCCCDNPPPPYCRKCLDRCSYGVAVVSPESLSTNVFFGCGNWTGEMSVVVPFMFEELLPPGYINNPFATDPNVSRSFISDIGAQVYHKRKVYTSGIACNDNILPQSILWLDAGIVADILCDPFSETPFSLQIRSFASVSILGAFGAGEFGCRGVWSWSGEAVFPLASYKSREPRRTCDDYQYCIILLQTPIEITADGETTSLGPYSSTNTYTHPDPAFMNGYVEGIGEALRAALTATFRITSRPSCKPVACNCATSLTGLKVMFEGKEFVMGTEATVSESGAYLETWTHDAPGTFRYRKNDLSNNETYVEKEVEVYCQTDNAVSPPVDRWYAAFINWCKDEANYATTYNEDYFIGYFECEPASDCEPFSAETSIPLGSPIDVERVDGWPQGSGCTVPGPATITLSQDCG